MSTYNICYDDDIKIKKKKKAVAGAHLTRNIFITLNSFLMFSKGKKIVCPWFLDSECAFLN